MPSLDIVCKFNEQEIDNATRQAQREIESRFDFKSGYSSLTFEKNKKEINIVAEDEMKLRSIHQILENKLAKRQIDCRILNYNKEIFCYHLVIYLNKIYFLLFKFVQKSYIFVNLNLKI